VDEIEVYQGDCLEVMGRIPAASIDLILADPPYGTTACKWDSVIPFAPMWAAIERVIKPNGAVVLFGSQPFTSALVMSKPEWFKYCWVWEKTRPSGFVHAKNAPLKGHEDIAVFSEGGISHASLSEQRTPYYPQGLRAFNRETYRPHRDTTFTPIIGHRPSHKKTIFQEHTNYPQTVLKFANPNHDTLHPTQKPVALLAYFIRTYTNKGETVLDFCMGSGSTGAACIEEGRRFIGIEKDAEYYRIASERLERERTKPRTMRMELDPA
jgi:site-specific DNA-methyltransferase (adenine-specific)